MARQKRYRLMWMDTRYEPGEVKAVAYDENGRKRAEQIVRTAGKPYRIVLKADKDTLDADLRMRTWLLSRSAWWTARATSVPTHSIR